MTLSIGVLQDYILHIRKTDLEEYVFSKLSDQHQGYLKGDSIMYVECFKLFKNIFRIPPEDTLE